MDISTILLAGALAFLIAGTIKGLVGVGLPTASIALMTLVLDPRTAIALILFPMITSNAWQMYRGGFFRRTLKRYWLFAVVLCTGVSLTVLLAKDVDERFLLATLGVVILIFVAVTWKNLMPRLPDRFDRPSQVGFGLAAGMIGGLTAAWAAPIAMYLTSRDVEKDEFIRATGFLIIVGSLPLCVAYASLGFLTGPLAGISLAMLLPTLAGFGLGERLRTRMSVKGFRTLILIVFVILGLNLIRRAIWYG